MSTLENLIENPDEWEDPMDEERKTRSYKAKITVSLMALYLLYRNYIIIKIEMEDLFFAHILSSMFRKECESLTR